MKQDKQKDRDFVNPQELIALVIFSFLALLQVLQCAFHIFHVFY